MNNKFHSILRPIDACKIIGVSKSTLLRMVDSGAIKPPIRISGRTKGFIEAEIQEFITKRINERDSNAEF